MPVIRPDLDHEEEVGMSNIVEKIRASRKNQKEKLNISDLSNTIDWLSDHGLDMASAMFQDTFSFCSEQASSESENDNAKAKTPNKVNRLHPTPD